jgi:hypothetical protein
MATANIIYSAYAKRSILPGAGLRSAGHSANANIPSAMNMPPGTITRNAIGAGRPARLKERHRNHVGKKPTTAATSRTRYCEPGCSYIHICMHAPSPKLAPYSSAVDFDVAADALRASVARGSPSPFDSIRCAQDDGSSSSFRSGLAHRKTKKAPVGLLCFSGAQDWTRTSTRLLPLAPQASASTNSATCA